MKPDVTVSDQRGCPPAESASDADTNQSLIKVASFIYRFADEVVGICAAAA